MTSIQIKTNNQARPLLTYDELTTKQQAFFGELELEQVDNWKGFVFKGQAYCLDDFVMFSEHSEEKKLGWDGGMAQNAFHAVIVKLDMQNLDSVVVGQLFC